MTSCKHVVSSSICVCFFAQKGTVAAAVTVVMVSVTSIRVDEEDPLVINADVSGSYPNYSSVGLSALVCSRASIHLVRCHFNSSFSTPRLKRFCLREKCLIQDRMTKLLHR